MKAITFNIQHGKNFQSGRIDLNAVADLIAREGGEIICLNEVYGNGLHPAFNDQAARIAERLGFFSFFSPAIQLDGAGPYGNAFLSAYPILEASTVPVPTVPRNHPGYFEDRAAFRAVVEIDSQKITVIGCHFGLQPEEQEECTKTVCALVDCSVYPVILMGDFNVTPENSVLLPIRERLRDTAEFPSGNLPTYPSDTPSEKIDYLFVSKHFTVEEAHIPSKVVSDHRPIVATLRL